MRSNRGRKLVPFWKQDTAALIAVVVYLVLAFCVTQGWSFLSEQADILARGAGHISSR